MPLDIHDVVKLRVDMVDIDDGDGGKVTLRKGEIGTIMSMRPQDFLIEFCDGADTKALIVVKREDVEPVETLRPIDGGIFHKD